MKKITILTLAYFFVPLVNVFAHGSEEATATSVLDSSWIGPLIAIIIIIAAVLLAKMIKKK